MPTASICFKDPPSFKDPIDPIEFHKVRSKAAFSSDLGSSGTRHLWTQHPFSRLFLEMTALQ